MFRKSKQVINPITPNHKKLINHPKPFRTRDNTRKSLTPVIHHPLRKNIRRGQTNAHQKSTPQKTSRMLGSVFQCMFGGMSSEDWHFVSGMLQRTVTFVQRMLIGTFTGSFQGMLASQKWTNKDIRRHCIVLTHRNSLHKSLCPVVICPSLT